MPAAYWRHLKPADESRRAAAVRYGERIANLAEGARGRHASIDIAFTSVDREGEVGGGIMAGALAYRLFIWLLPFALVLIGVLGLVSDATSDTPRDTASYVGVAGLVSRSVAEAAQATGHWYALAIGLPILVWTTRSLLRALIVVHRLVWGEARRAAPKPTLRASLRTLLLLVALFLVLPLSHALWDFGWILAAVLDALLYGALWLVASIRLPHRDAPWRALVPGSLLFAAGALVLGALSAYVLGPYASSREDTYGALGLASALLLGLYLINRLVVAAAVLNATLWERRSIQGAGP